MENDIEYERLLRLYNNGVSYMENDIIPHYRNYITLFEECYRQAKKHYPQIAHDACEKIAYCYYKLGQAEENEAHSSYLYRIFDLARNEYYNAEQLYKEGYDWLPSDCEDYFSECIRRVQNTQLDADYEYKRDD